jgi:dTDP-4-dehydrorhamnose reductase
VRYAVITGAQPWHQTDHPAGALELRTQAVFVPWDRWARASQMLDLLERRKTLEIDRAAPWIGVYGPDLMDVTLDLLFDGVTGAVDLRNQSGLSELDFAREVALVAEAPAELIRTQGSAGERSVFGWAAKQSYLPPLPTTLERFVREWRCNCDAPDWIDEPADPLAFVQAAE